MIIITGLSGAGKTNALNALEDIGYYTIDNLPVNLLPELYLEQKNISLPVAVGVDIRSQTSNIAQIPKVINKFRKENNDVKVLFLNASDEVLIKRFSETKRKHPLTDNKRPLVEAIKLEKTILSPLLLTADYTIDTSKINIYGLQDRIKSWVGKSSDSQPTITIESFGFKNGIPIDSDLMFDVRFLPNPYWQKEIRHLNGKDKKIQEFLLEHKETTTYIDDTTEYLSKWLPTYLTSNRSYLTIAIGCTGGKHRSVFVTESITKKLLESFENINIRHRDLKKHG